jgi:hypothetical protein
MFVKLRKPIGEMAVVTDKEKRLSEFLDVDAIGIIAHVINDHTGTAHFTLAFGAVDSKGKFHLDPANAQNVAQLVMDRNNPEQREAFDSLFRDEIGNSRCHYPREFFEQFMKDHLIPVAHRQIWGAKHPDMEVELNGGLIFQSPRRKEKSA